MNKEELEYFLAKQIQSLTGLQSEYGAFELDDELKKAIVKVRKAKSKNPMIIF